jgi:hypothetical protein
MELFDAIDHYDVGDGRFTDLALAELQHDGFRLLAPLTVPARLMDVRFDDDRVHLGCWPTTTPGPGTASTRTARAWSPRTDRRSCGPCWRPPGRPGPTSARPGPLARR